LEKIQEQPVESIPVPQNTVDKLHKKRPVAIIQLPGQFVEDFFRLIRSGEDLLKGLYGKVSGRHRIGYLLIWRLQKR
jgi:hypothetical protein